MEGPNLRSFPRTVFGCPVELCLADKTIRVERADGNLSVHGLYLHAEKLPVNAALHIKIAATPPVEADGVVRFSDKEGVGIEFTTLDDANRQRLDELIAEMTEHGALPS